MILRGKTTWYTFYKVQNLLKLSGAWLKEVFEQNQGIEHFFHSLPRGDRENTFGETLIGKCKELGVGLKNVSFLNIQIK